jgi:hypothetical protein
LAHVLVFKKIVFILVNILPTGYREMLSSYVIRNLGQLLDKKAKELVITNDIIRAACR